MSGDLLLLCIVVGAFAGMLVQVVSMWQESQEGASSEPSPEPEPERRAIRRPNPRVYERGPARISLRRSSPRKPAWP